jgi:drug/metabolite transporter (DMT)-like permease
MPPLQLTTLTFFVAFLLAVSKWIICKNDVRKYLKLPLSLWIVGVGGLFGYHFLYFVALKNAPPAEASLIAYLWPVLIVLFSALLPGERLRWFHIVGVVLGLAGAALLILKEDGFSFNQEFLAGYLAAGSCALIWSAYSVLSRRYGSFPTDVIGVFCGVTAVLAFISHLTMESWIWPASPGIWLAVIGLGLGPVGAAFFLWDVGVKKGEIQTLGVLSYMSPLFSTLILLIAGIAAASSELFLACGLITLGAFVGSFDLLASVIKKAHS